MAERNRVKFTLPEFLPIFNKLIAYYGVRDELERDEKRKIYFQNLCHFDMARVSKAILWMIKNRTETRFPKVAEIIHVIKERPFYNPDNGINKCTCWNGFFQGSYTDEAGQEISAMFACSKCEQGRNNHDRLKVKWDKESNGYKREEHDNPF